MAPEPGATSEPVDLDLLVLAVPHYLGGHLRPPDGRLPGMHMRAIAREQHVIERDLAAGLGLEQWHLDRGPRLGAELVAAGGEDGVGHEGRTLIGTCSSVKPPHTAP